MGWKVLLGIIKVILKRYETVSFNGPNCIYLNMIFWLTALSDISNHIAN